MVQNGDFPNVLFCSKWLAIIVSLTNVLNETTYFIAKPKNHHIFNFQHSLSTSSNRVNIWESMHFSTLTYIILWNNIGFYDF